MAGNINPNPFTTRPEIEGTFGVVASTHWIATAVGMATLEKGGNAFDAACATAFTLQVVEPHLNGPGGDVPVVLYDVKRGKPELICGQGPAPAGATIAHYRSEGLDMVPGTGLLAACRTAHTSPSISRASATIWTLLPCRSKACTWTSATSRRSRRSSPSMTTRRSAG